MHVKEERRPEFIGWEITKRCNLRCPHCYSSSTASFSREFSSSECLAVIDSLIDLGTKVISWTGGEPLLREDLEALVSYAKNKGGIASGFTTNALLLNDRRAETLKEAGIEHLQISLDGSTPEKNRRMRNTTEDDFWRIIDAVRICKRLDIKMDLAMLLGEENFCDAADFINLAQDEGVDSVRFCGFVPAGRGADERIKKRLMFSEKLEELKYFIEKNSSSRSPMITFDPAFGPLPPEYLYHPCVAGVKTLYISSEGNVYPCSSLSDEIFLVGNIRERSLEDLWGDPKMTWVATFPKYEITSSCKECQHFDRCGGGCRGLTYSYTNDLYASFPGCLSRVESKRPSFIHSSE